MELFADLSQKARQRQPAMTVSAVSVADEDRKKNCRRPRNARKICLPQEHQTHKLPSFSEFDDYSLCVESKNDVSGSLNVDKRQAQEDCTERLCGNSSIEVLSQAVDEHCEHGCRQRNKRCPRSSAGMRKCDVISRSPAGLITSTPHPRSVTRLLEYGELVDSVPRRSEKTSNQLVDCMSQLQLFDTSIDADIGTCSCLVVTQYS